VNWYPQAVMSTREPPKFSSAPSRTCARLSCRLPQSGCLPRPNYTKCFSSQTHKAPLYVTARVCSPFIERNTTLAHPALFPPAASACTSLWPSCPCLLSPQMYKPPSDPAAALC